MLPQAESLMLHDRDDSMIDQVRHLVRTAVNPDERGAVVPGNDGNEESVLSGGTPPAASSQLALPPRLRISCARAMAAPCLPFLWNAAGSRETPNTPMMLSIMVDWTEGSAHHRALPNSTCTAFRFLLGNGDMERDDVA